MGHELTFDGLQLLREHQAKPTHSSIDPAEDETNDIRLQTLRLEKEELQEQYDELHVEHSSLSSQNVAQPPLDVGPSFQLMSGQFYTG